MTVPFFTSCLFPSSIKHGFFGRQGGVSKPPFNSLNCCFRQGDHQEDVRKNRKIIATTLGVFPDHLLSLNQVHGDIVRVETGPRDVESPEADAMVTNVPGIALGILTADCAPILLADPSNRVIGAIHSGWKSAYLNIVEVTLKTMEKLGAKRSQVVSAIGPCIHQNSYEVDQAFKENFLRQSLGNESLFRSAQKQGHFLFNLPGYVERSLKEAGVKDIEIIAQDTYGNPESFYSYRYSTQQNSATGRQISVILLPSQ